jgi:hypothetical protein
VFTARYELKHKYNSDSVNITVNIILSSLLAQAACCWFRRSFLRLLFGRYFYRNSSGSSAVLTGLVVFLSQILGPPLHSRYTTIHKLSNVSLPNITAPEDKPQHHNHNNHHHHQHRTVVRVATSLAMHLSSCIYYTFQLA